MTPGNDTGAGGYTIQRIAATFRETINPTASLGFIGLATDRASLVDFRDFVAPFPGVAVHATRIASATSATPETLSMMRDGLRDGAAMLVPGQPLGSISYSCTSGTVAIGPETVHSEIQRAAPGCPVATPIEAAVEGLRLAGAKRISLLVPYLMETAAMVADYFVSEGFSLDRVSTFDLEGDPDMNRVDPDCIIDAALAACDPESDALFISCTGWRTKPVTAPLEEKLRKPVLSSNQVLAWKALRLAGVQGSAPGAGSLFAMG